MKNRFVSFDLILALLFIVAFFLPWLDMWGIKIIGWDIPELQKRMTKVTNLFKFFSKNKDWLYSTHIVYIIPLLSVISMLLWVFLKQKSSRVILLVTGIFGLVVTANLFYKLPKAGSGVYLLGITSVISIFYAIIVLKRKKKVVISESVIDIPEEDID